MKFYKLSTDTLPKVFIMNREKLNDKKTHRTRVAEEYILYYILSGHLELTDNGERVTLVAGDMYLFQKGEYHFPNEKTECSYFYLHLEANFSQISPDEAEEIIEHKYILSISSYPCSKEYDGAMVFPKKIHISKPSVDKKIIRLFEEGSLENGMEKGEYYKTFSALKAFEILITAYRYFSEDRRGGSGKLDTDIIKSVVTYIEKNYEKDITGEILQQQFGYNFDYMNKCFKRITGKTVFSILREVRIENAKIMLKIKNISVSQVAEKCGFCDVYYFSRVFKSSTGCTPTEYIRSIKH